MAELIPDIIHSGGGGGGDSNVDLTELTGRVNDLSAAVTGALSLAQAANQTAQAVQSDLTNFPTHDLDLGNNSISNAAVVQTEYLHADQMLGSTLSLSQGLSVAGTGSLTSGPGGTVLRFGSLGGRLDLLSNGLCSVAGGLAVGKNTISDGLNLDVDGPAAIAGSVGVGRAPRSQPGFLDVSRAILVGSPACLDESVIHAGLSIVDSTAATCLRAVGVAGNTYLQAPSQLIVSPVGSGTVATCTKTTGSQILGVGKVPTLAALDVSGGAALTAPLSVSAGGATTGTLGVTGSALQLVNGTSSLSITPDAFGAQLGPVLGINRQCRAGSGVVLDVNGTCVMGRLGVGQLHDAVYNVNVATNLMVSASSTGTTLRLKGAVSSANSLLFTEGSTDQWSLRHNATLSGKPFELYNVASTTTPFRIDNLGSVSIPSTAGADSTFSLRVGGTSYLSGNTIVGAPTALTNTYRLQVDTSTPSALMNCTYAEVPAMRLVPSAAPATTWNGAVNTVMLLGKDATTSRSASLAGTLNSSGADYSEYLRKCRNDFTLAKGDVAGVDASGRLTNLFSEAITFLVKSTDPCLVGGDVWGTTLGERPDASDAEALAAYEAQVQAERAWYDRMAFAGRVPVNLLGATPGDYVLPAPGPDDSIIATAVPEADITFAQYRKAVGRVLSIQEDGRAFISVIVH